MVTQIQLGNIFSAGGKNVLGGTGSGIDTAKLIEDLTTAKRLPAVKLEERIELNTKKKAALAELKQILATFKDASNFLRNPPGVGNADSNVFRFRTTSVTSNSSVAGENYLTATANAGAQIQNYAITDITFLAKAKKQESNIFAIPSASDQVVFAAPGAGQFGAGTFTVNGANITLNDGDSLSTVAARFNAVKDTTGISASVIQVSPGNFKLVFTATETGLSADFDLGDPGTVTSDPSGVLTNITFADTQLAQNAQFTFDGVAITRETNNIDDLVDGLTINLKQTTPPGTELDLNVTPDTELVKAGITNFIDAYNEFRLFVSKQTEVDSSGNFTEDAVLGNNSSVRNILNTLSLELSRSVQGILATDPSRLADIGIKFSDFPGDDETPFTRNILTFDEAKLDTALATDFDGVRRVFEFDFISDVTNIQVFTRTNALNVSSFSLNIDNTNAIYQATYDPGTGPVTIDVDAILLSGGNGFLIKGQEGTVLEGLQLIYTGVADTVANIEVTQGIGDRLFNELDKFLKSDTGAVDIEIASLEVGTERLEEEIARIDEQVERFREQLLIKFGALEKAISSINTLLQALDAQAQAQANA